MRFWLETIIIFLSYPFNNWWAASQITKKWKIVKVTWWVFQNWITRSSRTSSYTFKAWEFEVRTSLWRFASGGSQLVKNSLEKAGRHAAFEFAPTRNHVTFPGCFRLWSTYQDFFLSVSTSKPEDNSFSDLPFKLLIFIKVHLKTKEAKNIFGRDADDNSNQPHYQLSWRVTQDLNIQQEYQTWKAFTFFFDHCKRKRLDALWLQGYRDKKEFHFLAILRAFFNTSLKGNTTKYRECHHGSYSQSFRHVNKSFFAFMAVLTSQSIVNSGVITCRCLRAHFSAWSCNSITRNQEICFHFFPVPPRRPWIVDDVGNPVGSLVGPYKEDDVISLTCSTSGGKY